MSFLHSVVQCKFVSLGLKLVVWQSHGVIEARTYPFLLDWNSGDSYHRLTRDCQFLLRYGSHYMAILACWYVVLLENGRQWFFGELGEKRQVNVFRNK